MAILHIIIAYKIKEFKFQSRKKDAKESKRLWWRLLEGIHISQLYLHGLGLCTSSPQILGALFTWLTTLAVPDGLYQALEFEVHALDRQTQ